METSYSYWSILEEPPAPGFVLALWSWYRKTSAALFLELQGGKFTVTISLRRAFRNISTVCIRFREQRNVLQKNTPLAKWSVLSIVSTVNTEVCRSDSKHKRLWIRYQLTELLQKKCTPEKVSLGDQASPKAMGAGMSLNLWLTAGGPFLAFWNVRFDPSFHNMIFICKVVLSLWQRNRRLKCYPVLIHSSSKALEPEERGTVLPFFFQRRTEQWKVEMKCFQTGKEENIWPGHITPIDYREQQKLLHQQLPANRPINPQSSSCTTWHLFSSSTILMKEFFLFSFLRQSLTVNLETFLLFLSYHFVLCCHSYYYDKKTYTPLWWGTSPKCYNSFRNWVKPALTQLLTGITNSELISN